MEKAKFRNRKNEVRANIILSLLAEKETSTSSAMSYKFAEEFNSNISVVRKAVSNTLARLLRDGFICPRPNQGKKNYKDYQLTDKGSEYYLIHLADSEKKKKEKEKPTPAALKETLSPAEGGAMIVAYIEKLKGDLRRAAGQLIDLQEQMKGERAQHAVEIKDRNMKIKDLETRLNSPITVNGKGFNMAEIAQMKG